jgi:hypothetical protein
MIGKVYNMALLTRKARLCLSGILLLICSLAWAEDSKSGALVQYEEVSHAFKGCPENSDCDEEMGQQMLKWKDLVAQELSSDTPKLKKTQDLSAFVEKHGWHSHFYAKPTLKAVIAPILFSSSCALHNSKDPALVLLKGEAFIKGVKDESAIVSKGNTEYKIKIGENLILQKIIFYPNSKNPPQSYWLPLGEKPLYIEGDQLVALVESFDFYALLKIDPSGNWNFSLPPSGSLLKYTEDIQEVECPKNAEAVPFGFQKTWCSTLSDKDGAPAGVTQLFWACD